MKGLCRRNGLRPERQASHGDIAQFGDGGSPVGRFRHIEHGLGTQMRPRGEKGNNDKDSECHTAPLPRKIPCPRCPNNGWNNTIFHGFGIESDDSGRFGAEDTFPGLTPGKHPSNPGGVNSCYVIHFRRMFLRLTAKSPTQKAASTAKLSV